MAKERYFLFAGCDYYPCGGLGDLKGSFDSTEEAMQKGAASDWAHIAKINEDGELVVVMHLVLSDWVEFTGEQRYV